MISLTPLQNDTLKEIVNIGIGRAAGGLNQLVGSPVTLHVPEIVVTNLRDLGKLKHKFPQGDIAAVVQPFRGDYLGKAALIFSEEESNKLVNAVMGQEEGTETPHEMREEALKEIGNIVVNAVIGTVGNLLESPLEFFLPEYHHEPTFDHLLRHQSSPDSGGLLWLVDVQFEIEAFRVSGYVWVFFEMGDINVLLWLINRQLETGAASK